MGHHCLCECFSLEYFCVVNITTLRGVDNSFIMERHFISLRSLVRCSFLEEISASGSTAGDIFANATALVCVGGWVGGCVCEWMDGWMDGWVSFGSNRILFHSA